MAQGTAPSEVDRLLCTQLSRRGWTITGASRRGLDTDLEVDLAGAPARVRFGRLCNWAVSTRMMHEADGEEIAESKLDPARLLACSKRLLTMKPAQREEIAHCMNSCGDDTGIARCLYDYGSDSFPACYPEAQDEDR